MRRLQTLLVAVASSATLVACSSSSSGAGGGTSPSPSGAAMLTAAQYRAALSSVGQEENKAQHRVQAAFHASTVAKIRATLTTFALDQQHVAEVLSGLRPPANAVSANAAAAKAFADNAAAIKAVVTKIASFRTPKQALAYIQHAKSAQQAGQEIDAALAKLHKLGYVGKT